MDAAVDAMVLFYYLAFPADLKFSPGAPMSRWYGPTGFSFPRGGVFTGVIPADVIFVNDAWMYAGLR